MENLSKSSETLKIQIMNTCLLDKSIDNNKYHEILDYLNTQFKEDFKEFVKSTREKINNL